MSTDSYSQYKTYDDQPDYFEDKEKADEKWEEWLANRIKEILTTQIELIRKW